jgi:hypothetical protein
MTVMKIIDLNRRGLLETTCIMAAPIPRPKGAHNSSSLIFMSIVRGFLSAGKQVQN